MTSHLSFVVAQSADSASVPSWKGMPSASQGVPLSGHEAGDESGRTPPDFQAAHDSANGAFVVSSPPVAKPPCTPSLTHGCPPCLDGSLGSSGLRAMLGPKAGDRSCRKSADSQLGNQSLVARDSLAFVEDSSWLARFKRSASDSGSPSVSAGTAGVRPSGHPLAFSPFKRPQETLRKTAPRRQPEQITSVICSWAGSRERARANHIGDLLSVPAETDRSEESVLVCHGLSASPGEQACGSTGKKEPLAEHCEAQKSTLKKK